MVGILMDFIKWTLIIVLTLLVIGILYEQTSRWLLEREAFKNKTLVSINEVPLHYVKKGIGNCTVIFVSGMGSSHAIWQEVQDSVAPDAVTISYDRSGLMFSANSGLAVTNKQVSNELELLLQKTGCPKPYIVVGHSMAGIYLRPFIVENQADIAGVILVDAAHPEQIDKASPELIKALRVPPRWLIEFAVRTGIYRLVFSFLPISAEIPMSHPLHNLEKDFFYRSYKKTLEELSSDRSNFKEAASYSSFGALPLTIITGNADIRYAALKSAELKKEYQQLLGFTQHDLLKLSSNSRLVYAAGSGHLVQINNSDLISLEIKEILRGV